MNLLRHPLKSALCFLLLPLPLHATGDYWAAPNYLDGSGKVLKSTPEFFWNQEIHRLAEKYRAADSKGMSVKRAAEKADGLLIYRFQPGGEGNDEKSGAGPGAAADLDIAEFDEALKSGKIKPADPAAATAAHRKAREAIDAHWPLPGGEVDSEFADYHAGAEKPYTPEAAAAWQKLLARPGEERHYRSVWAAFMLGKNALSAKDWAGAVKYFELCRSLAREGFADSQGLAADSYGWQARAELSAERYPQAARLYLTQLALGDPSATVSLKRLIPDWTTPDTDTLPGEAAPEETAAAPAPDAAKSAARWEEAAKDPAIRELVTAHILATESTEWESEFVRSRQWMEVIEKAGLTKVEDAVSLAWLAYNAGDYKTARKWLAKAGGASPLGRWLEAKFALRDGRLDAAAGIMPEVAKALPLAPAQLSTVSAAERARGETGALLYAKGEFTAAFEHFIAGNCDHDVQFMIESILTPGELLAAAAKLPAPNPWNADGTRRDFTEAEFRAQVLRSIIGRRLVREGKVKEARPLLSEEERKDMEEYITQAVQAEDAKAAADARARAWYEAARIMKESGHAFRGTEDDFHKPEQAEPQAEISVGGYTVRPERLAGKFTGPTDYSGEKPVKPKPRSIFIPVSEAEKKRLAATASHHAKAMRTRMIAAAHLMKAAALMQDGSEAKARALNTAGFWLQDIDNAAADKIYYQIERSYGNTPTGAAVLKKHWFTGETPPWSADEPEPAPADGPQ